MTVLNLQVASTDDNAIEKADNTGFQRTNLQVIASATASARSTLGTRFVASIPVGALVNAATMQLGVVSTKTGDDPNLDIYGEAIDNAPNFVTNADVTDRARTTASSAWVATNVGTGWKTSPDCAAPIQEVINRPGWASGNGLVMLLAGRSSGSGTIGPDTVGGTYGGAKLDITFSDPPPYATTSIGSSITSHVVNLPPGIEAGDGILALSSVRNPGNWDTIPSGFAELASQDSGGVGELTVFAATATGSEGATATWVASVGTTAVWHVRRIPAAQWHGSTPPEVTLASSGGVPGTNPNPPSITPSWGSAETLFVAAGGGAAEAVTLTDYPDNYEDGIWSLVSAGGASAYLGSAIRTATTATEDPGGYTTAASRWWYAATIAIRPPGDAPPEPVEVAPEAAELTLTGETPTVGATAHVTVAVDTAGASLAGEPVALTLTQHVTAAPSAGSLAATGAAVAASLTAHVVVSAAPQGVTVEGATPGVTRTAHVFVSPEAAALAATGAIPNVAATADRSFAPAAATAALEGATAAVALTAHVAIAPAAGSLAATGAAPSLDISGNVRAAPDAAALALAGASPTVAMSAHVVLAPGAGELVAAGAMVTIQAGGNVQIAPAAAALVTSAATPAAVITSHVSITPAGVALVLAPASPVVMAGASIALSPDAASLVASTAAAVVVASAHIALGPTLALLALATFAPEIRIGGWVPGSVRVLTAAVGACQVWDIALGDALVRAAACGDVRMVDVPVGFVELVDRARGDARLREEGVWQ